MIARWPDGTDTFTIVMAQLRHQIDHHLPTRSLRATHLVDQLAAAADDIVAEYAAEGLGG